MIKLVNKILQYHHVGANNYLPVSPIARKRAGEKFFAPTVALLLFLFSLFTLIPLSIHAQTQELYAFETPEKQVEFDTLLKDLRCLVCQGQDLHDSQTPFAENLREQIQEWIKEGKSQQEILDILTSRYGQSISFDPQLQTSTYILWIAPFGLLALFIIFFIRRNKS